MYLKFRETPEGFDNIGSHYPLQMKTTRMGRMAVLDEQTLENEFDKVYQGVNRAFDEMVVRLANPIVLLELGFQTAHPYLSTLVWVMGLDMLFMAGEKEVFVERVSGFLGASTWIFPVLLNRQPALTVGEVLEDLFDLRNKVAHGQAIPEKPFLQKRDIADAGGARMNSEGYLYSQVLMDCALFLLAKSLRKIMLGKLIDVVKDEAKWKLKLKTDARLEQARKRQL